MSNRLLESLGTDPARNLALEEALLLQRGEPSLFLWQNAHTVVIGRGQNAWKECRAQQLEEEGGTLVRRSTGGGAVYHDLGNLNFSFIMPKGLYDVPRQLNVIRRAVKTFGIETESSGRNDIVLKESGAKFSGNAFRLTQAMGLHHGTILFDVDMMKLGRYLQPSKAKLQAKGVESVRARVGNLRPLAPQMTIPYLKAALFEAFSLEYGKSEYGEIDEALDPGQVHALTEKYRSWEWTYGRTPRFDVTLEARFPWGGVELMLRLQNGVVQEARCFTDANDPELADRVAPALLLCPFTPEGLGRTLLESEREEDRDIAEWLGREQI